MELVPIIIIFLLYFLPAINAELRKTKNRGSVFVINLFLGCTVLGWIIALAMSASGDLEPSTREQEESQDKDVSKSNRKTIKCPNCFEEILSQAKICRFCNRDVPPPKN